MVIVRIPKVVKAKYVGFDAELYFYISDRILWNDLWRWLFKTITYKYACHALED